MGGRWEEPESAVLDRGRGQDPLAFRHGLGAGSGAGTRAPAGDVLLARLQAPLDDLCFFEASRFLDKRAGLP